jgi:hypothetical protein
VQLPGRAVARPPAVLAPEARAGVLTR